MQKFVWMLYQAYLGELKFIILIGTCHTTISSSYSKVFVHFGLHEIHGDSEIFAFRLL